jgi:peptidoglycan hydrolase CwlO-like protein
MKLSLAFVTATGVVVSVLAAACVRASQFDRYLEDEQWSQAAREFSRDPSLRLNEHELYRAGLLYGTPGRTTYNPDSARVMFSSLLNRFPGTSHQEDAEARLGFLDQLVIAQHTAEARIQKLEARIDSLGREVRLARARADSAGAQSDSLRGAIKGLETERRERDKQLEQLRSELQQLKEIDLKDIKSRPPARPIKP